MKCTDLIGPGDDLVVDVRDVHAQRHVVAEEIRHHPPKDVEMKVCPRCSSQVKSGQVRSSQVKSSQVKSSQFS